MSRLSLTLLFLVFAAATAYFVLLPQWQGISDIRLDLRRLGEMRSDLRLLSEKRDALRQAYAGIPASDREKLDEVAPAVPATSEAIVAFETMAQRAGVSLDSLSFTGSRSKPGGAVDESQVKGFGAIPLSFAIRGSYESVGRFLTHLERSQRLVDVTAMNFSSSPGILSVAFTAQMYYRQ